MKKQLLLKPLLTLALVMICGSAWGATTIDLTFDLSKNPGNSWPTVNSTTLTNYTYELDGTNYTFSLKNVKCNSGYLMLTSTAVLGLPAMNDYKLVKIQAKNSSGCSTSTKVGISSSSSSESYVSGGAIQTFSSTSSTYTYELSGTEFNTSYFIYVTNKNCQLTQLTLTYEMSSNPVISAGNVTIESDATSGEIAFSVTNPVEGKSLSASSADSWISNIAVSGNKVTFTATKNALHVERTGTITLKYEGANDKNVTVTQKKSSVFSSLEDLVEAGEPTKDGEEVTVSFEGVVIKEIITNGVYLDVYDTNNNSIEIYCKNVPTGWIAGGTVSATALTCPWKKYGSTWELCPTDWADIEYTAPATYTITINPSENGSVSADASEYAAGVTVALTVTPSAHYTLFALSVTKSTGGIVPLTDDNTFIMPACGVTVSATFKELDKFNVQYYSKNEFLSEKTVYDGEKIADAPTPTAPSGWTFCGWTEDSDYSGNDSPSYFNGVVTNSTKLYAVFSNEGDTPVWQIVTDKINVGDQIVIAAKDYDCAISTTQNKNNRGQAAITKSEDKGTATFGEDAQVINVEAGMIAETFAFNVGTGYLCAASSSSNYLKAETTLSNNSSWTVSINDSVATIKAQGTYTRNLLQYNESSTLFSCYSSGQKNVCIYRKQLTYSLLVFDATISDAKYATLCLPFNFTVPTGVTAYTAEASASSVALTAIEGVVPANTGVIIYSETPDTYTFTGSAETPATLGTNNLVGVTAATELAGGYILAKDTDGTAKFFTVAPNTTLAANKAYLDYSGSASALSIRMGDATGIRTVEEQQVNTYFDLMGRKVQNPERGIYILNGKKVFVK